VRNTKLKDEIEIDESLFEWRVKHNRRNPHRGLKIWIFGMVKRDTNTIILHPVNNRFQDTLVTLIMRHVEPGATIYSDGWSTYCDLKDLGIDISP
jgi:IS1 family transposase